MKTVNRAIDMLSCFSAERPLLAVSELAKLLNVHKSMASRLAATLRKQQFLHLDPATRRYRIGVRVFELGQLFGRSATLNEVATPHLRSLTRSVGHASHICVLDGLQVLTVACVQSAHELQVAVQAGERRSVHATAAGKLFLAYGSNDLFRTLSAGGQFPKVGPRTIQSILAMKRELAAIRKAGIAHNREESARGVGGVAAPVFSSNEILASVMVMFPLALVTQSEWDHIAVQARNTASSISNDLARGTVARKR